MDLDVLNRRITELQGELVRCDDRLLKIAKEKSDLEHTISRIRGAIEVLGEYQREMMQKAKDEASERAQS